MESVGEQCLLAQQPLITRTKLDFGDRERVSQVKGAVHVGVWKVPEPLGVFLLDLCGRQSSQLIRGGGVDVEDVLVFPFLLVSFLEVYQVVAFARLRKVRLDDNGRGMEVMVRTWANSMV
jgi:hypothetical protein